MTNDSDVLHAINSIIALKKRGWIHLYSLRSF